MKSIISVAVLMLTAWVVLAQSLGPPPPVPTEQPAQQPTEPLPTLPAAAPALPTLSGTPAPKAVEKSGLPLTERRCRDRFRLTSDERKECRRLFPPPPPEPISEARRQEILREQCQPKGNFLSKSTFSGPRITGRVVDATSKAPLEGAVVFAHWSAYTIKIHGVDSVGATVHAYEAVTDKEGHFEIPAWGSLPMVSDWDSEARHQEEDKKLPLWQQLLFRRPTLEFRAFREPFLVVFKLGYSTQGRTPEMVKSDFLPPDGSLAAQEAQFFQPKSAFDGESFELFRLPHPYQKSERDSFFDVYNKFDEPMRVLLKQDHCAWRQFPQTLLYSRQFQSEPAISKDDRLGIEVCDALWMSEGCPSFKQFLLENEK